MTGSDVFHILFGAALVTLGVLSAAFADRIRGGRSEGRGEAAGKATRAPSAKAPRLSRAEEQVADGNGVIEALMAAGYNNQAAAEATWACSAFERTTPERGVAAAGRRCGPPSKGSRGPRVEATGAGSMDGGEGAIVIAALVAAGYKKQVATEATWACNAAERATAESWTAAALRRCALGGMS